jgi:uncharacterized membrane protein (DUF2068 family)
LIPFEIYEIAHHVTVVRIATFLVNVAVVVYLVARLRRPHQAPAAERGPTVRPAATAGPSTAG